MPSPFKTCFDAGDFDGALRIARAMAPGVGRNRATGASLLALGRTDEAIVALRRAVRVDPQDFVTMRNLGIAQERAARPDLALRSFRAAAALREDPRVEAAIGRMLAQNGEPEQAEGLLRAALALAPNHPRLRYELAQVLLARGDWAEGWPLYESRLELASMARPASDVRWDGRKRAGDVVVLAAEQGAGDAIQFARFAPVIAARGQPVILKVQARHVTLLRGLGPNMVVIAHQQGIETPDLRQVWAPLMSAPGLLGVGLTNVPAATPYLAVPEPVAMKWRGLLRADRVNIGIAWQGGPEADLDAGRSVPLRALAPLANIPGVNLINLQKGFGAEQVASCGFSDRLITPADFDEGEDAFLDTAGLMTGLDLVISTDTAIAHLAGALGRPVFLALQRHAEWRWMQGRDDSPWYPTMRLFRQTERGDWPGVFARITEAVRALAANSH